MIALSDYCRIRNNYCICYLGPCAEYGVLLDYLRPVIETSFVGLDFYVCCRDDFFPLTTSTKTFPISEFADRKKDLACMIELTYDGGNKHPIDTFLDDCQITNVAVHAPTRDKTCKCVIVSQGEYPTRPLTTTQVAQLRKMAVSKGFDPVIDGNWEDAGWVVGVESVTLFQALKAGISSSLVPTGVGTSLVKKVFPAVEILSLEQ